MSPIDSFGVLLLGADSSNPWTGLAGWAYHFSNGIGFGVAYGIFALGRRWHWGVVWGLILETATILTPFASTYRIKGQWGLIAIAYLGHIAYGYPLGKIVQRAGSVLPRAATPLPISWCLGALAIVLLLWHRPFAFSDQVLAGRRVAPGPSAVVVRGRFVPLWLRVAPGGCATLRNDDSEAHKLTGAEGEATLVPGVVSKVCFGDEGIHRIKVANEPYSGGFVIVDPEMSGDRSPDP